MTRLVVADVIERIHRLPTLPGVVLELLATMDDDDCNVEKLAKTISVDPTLAAKVMRIANSSFYGMSRQVTAMPHAISTLGFRTIRHLVTTAALMDAVCGETRGSLDAKQFWRHSLATAILSQLLAPRWAVHAETAYITGLLHDIGRLVLATQFSDEYHRVLECKSQHGISLLQAERTYLALDHAVVGHLLTSHWKFPVCIQQALAEHHEEPDEHTGSLTRVIVAANALAQLFNLEADNSGTVMQEWVTVLHSMEVDETAAIEIYGTANKQLEAASQIFNS